MASFGTVRGRILGLFAVGWTLAVGPVHAQKACQLAAQKPMLITQLFFGRSIAGRAPLSEGEWRSFATRVLTRNFPDGFTAYDADGQWLNKAHRIVRERTKVVVIAAELNPTFATRLAAVTDAYRQEFHQLSVGVITQSECAAF